MWILSRLVIMFIGFPTAMLAIGTVITTSPNSWVELPRIASRAGVRGAGGVAPYVRTASSVVVKIRRVQRVSSQDFAPALGNPPWVGVHVSLQEACG